MGPCTRRREQKNLLVFPDVYRPLILNGLQKEMGHLGTERTLNLIGDSFFSTKMQRDRTFCDKWCLRKRKPNRQGAHAPMLSIETTHPFQLVSLGFVHQGECRGGYEYILPAMDHYTRITQAYATTNKSVKTVAAKLLSDSRLKCGFPEKLHRDLRRESEPLHHLKALPGVRGSNICPHSPQGPGQTERSQH